MGQGSRKKKRPGGRNVSPPLAPSPLLTRNLQLLPVGLTQLPNDETFVAQLRHDIDDLLSTFAEVLLLKILTISQEAYPRREAGLSSQRIDTFTCSQDTAHHLVSPFSVFAHIWRQRGWHYVQFAFADHNDSKRTLGDAICRVLLEHLKPYVTERNRNPVHNKQEVSDSLAFANLGQVFKAMAIVFALYLFWTTQVYPTSGIGVKHCRPAMERIAIEQDYYDILLDLPEAALKHLKDEQRTARLADAMAADLIEVLCRLVGQPCDERSLVQDSPSAPPVTPMKPSGKLKRRQAWQDDAEAGDRTSKHGLDPAFDIIPASSVATRLPRSWPSVRVMSSLEANKEFGRIGTVVRISPLKSAGANVASTTDAEPPAAEHGEAVAGLSRGDVVRLKARQRLAVAKLTISKLLDADSASHQIGTSEILAQTALDNASSRSTTRPAARYEIETPRWITSAKYTAKLQPWLQQSTVPMQPWVQRASHSKKRYRESRDTIMRSGDSATEAEAGRHEDYGEWILRSFREERRALEGQSVDSQTQQPALTVGQASESGGAQDLPDVNDAGTLSVDSLYRLAAERTKTAAVERGEMLKSAKAQGSRSK
ncbi:uncharacterized protein SPSC_05355 [Sporisorium scitamineum]|uniref:Uncharacterized protein n=1 Tax=Sporisorium scitamineum TaxID=49012 RepID=A0A0F7S533_9BASI|nr:hypothetical protein [Sporisorium scitamineum]CDU25462.1 uncharacterized protein SPSC_05355 [Sporisorium scitamineum]